MSTVPFLDLDQLREEERSPAKTYSAIYKKILSKCHEKIRKINKRTTSRECHYEIPIFLPGYPMYDIKEAKGFVLHHLNKNGILAESVGETKIYISWKPEDVNQQQFEIQAQKSNNFNAGSDLSPDHHQPPHHHHQPPRHHQPSNHQVPLSSYFRSNRPESFKTQPNRRSFKAPKYDPRLPSGVNMNPPEYSQPSTLPYMSQQKPANAYQNPTNQYRSNRPLKYPETVLQKYPDPLPNLDRKSKIHTIFKEKESMSDAFKKPIDMVEPPKYIQARTINILPETPLLHQNIEKTGKSKKDEEEGEKVTMLQYDKKLGDMLPVNTRKLQSLYPNISYKKGRPPF
jgi:hypothetical protein